MDEPEQFWEPHYARMTRKFGSVEAFERVKAAHRLMPRAVEVGLDADGWSDDNLDRRRQSSTLRAHRLIMWLDATVGWERAEAAYAHMNKAHFVDQGLLNDTSLLVGAAAAAGVDEKAATDFIGSAELEPAVRRLLNDVHALGVHSIPTLFVGGRLALSGAAGSDEVLRVLREAAASADGPGRRFKP